MSTAVDRGADFTKVRGRLLLNECSPRSKDPDFKGLLINAPEKVKLLAGPGAETLLDAGVKVQLCGSVQLDHGFMGLGDDFVEAIVFVAVDARTHQPYAGTFQPVPNAVPPPDGGSTEAVPGLVVTKYYNPDLAAILPDLPAAEATYLVYATLGPYQSNVLRIDIARPGKP